MSKKQKNRKSQKKPRRTKKDKTSVFKKPTRVVKTKETLKIRDDILQLIEKKESIWLILKDGKYGLAGYLHLPNDVVYVEMLFFHDKKKGLRFEWHTPLKNTKVLEEVEKHLIDRIDLSVDEVFNDLEHQIKAVSQEYSAMLENEIKQLEAHYESHPILNNRLNREVFIYGDGFQFWFEINFVQYPKCPTIQVPEEALNVIGINVFPTESILDWVDWKPLPVFEVVQKIDRWVNEQVKKNWNPDNQKIICANFQLPNSQFILDFDLTHGQALGIIESEQTRYIDLLFQAFQSMIKKKNLPLVVFGTEIKKKFSSKIIVLDFPTEKQTIGSLAKETLIRGGLLENARLKLALQLKGKSKGETREGLSKKEWTTRLLKDLDLYNIRWLRIKALTDFEYFRAQIANALVLDPQLLLIKIPAHVFGRMDLIQFNQMVDIIKENYHVPILMAGDKRFMEHCDKLLLMDTNTNRATATNLEELLDQMPQGGEMLTIQFTKFSSQDAQQLRKIKNIQIFEDLPQEKYTISSKVDVDQFLSEIFSKFGDKIYNYRRFKPSLSEFLLFKEKLNVR